MSKRTSRNYTKRLKKIASQAPISTVRTEERNKGRQEVRQLSVYAASTGIDGDWSGLQSILLVERVGSHQGREVSSISYYLSSLPAQLPASAFNAGIRGHWGIEMLHYIKDTAFGEDNSKLRKGHSPSNMSVIRNIAINLFSHLGSQSLASSMGQIAHDIKELSLLF
ncbi:MAG: ISAs1 family transposase [Cytophagales bacterium]|nr:ISAs1 family transposase [Cytophagales bacterium]